MMQGERELMAISDGVDPSARDVAKPVHRRAQNCFFDRAALRDQLLEGINVRWDHRAVRVESKGEQMLVYAQLSSGEHKSCVWLILSSSNSA
jgi:hypothetical protein